MKKVVFILYFVFVILCLFILTNPIYAGYFYSDYYVLYAVTPSGNTIVTQTISLTNKTLTQYPKEYSILIDSSSIQNIVARDSKDVLTPQVKKEDGKTNIIIPFIDRVVGMGQTLSFSLRYETTDITKKIGNIWEIILPGINNDPDMRTYNVRLQVPSSFGTVAYTKPAPLKEFEWSKEHMISGGVQAVFGESQDYKVDIIYSLVNSSVSMQKETITLPPDTVFQKVTLSSINPEPENIYRDDDGNWLAEYSLIPSSTKDIQATFFITTFVSPRSDFSKTTIDKNLYTRSLPYWETDNEDLHNLVQNYNTPQKIYDYVRTKLSYNYTRLNMPFERYGSIQAFKKPNDALCTEFTDLFISLARLAGIPAREVVGYAYTTNPKLRPFSSTYDILHTWPEYYNEEKNLWIPIDPTWANTTGGIDYFHIFDFNHVAFSIHGISSTLPKSAGMYKEKDSLQKQISVSFQKNEPVVKDSSFFVTLDMRQPIQSGTNIRGQVIVKNIKSQADKEVNVELSVWPYRYSINKTFSYIPPLGTVSIPFSFYAPKYIMIKSGKIIINVNNERTEQLISIQPFYRFFIPVGIIAIITLALTIVFIRKNSWNQNFKKK